MGFVANTANRVREFFRQDKEALALRMAKGTTSAGYPGSGYDLLQAYGYDVLSDYLKLEHDLLARFVDYEEMDDYPELSCLTYDAPVFTLEWGWMPIGELVSKSNYHVLAYDKDTRSLVPAKATAILSGAEGHAKPMVRVELDSGQHLDCTEDHPFLTKDERWVRADALTPGQRLMPGLLRLGSLSGGDNAYWQVHQPNSDSALKSVDSKRWVWVHRLVAETQLGATKGDIVHHKNGSTLDNSPDNLSLETASSHAVYHIALLDNSKYFPEWTPTRREAAAAKMQGNTFSLGNKLSADTRKRMSQAGKGRSKSKEWREKIGKSQPNRIDIDRSTLEAALHQGGTVAEAARLLGVSWSKVKRASQALDLLVDGTNHRVVRITRMDARPAVYDLNVQGYHNFVCGGVVVHNTALDIYADDASQPETQLNRSIWVESKDESVQGLLDDLLHKTLRMDEDVWEIARTMCKYGNDYEEILVTEKGVEGLNYLPAPTVRRIEGPRGELFGFVQDFKGKFGYCLARGSRVWKVGGLVEIQNFKDGDVVAAHKEGKQVPLRVKKLHTNGTKRVFRLRTCHRELFLTENHPVLVERAGGRRDWVQVKDLKLVRYNGKKRNIDYSRSDKLVISTRMPKGEIPEWKDIQAFDPFEQIQGNKGSPVALKLPERITEDFCQLFGFLLGDGWLEGDTRVAYARGVYPELNDKYDALLRALGPEVSIDPDGTQTRVSSVHLARLLLSLGWTNGASEKRIPSWAFGLPESHREALLAGFIDADGWDTETSAGTACHHFEISNYEMSRDLKNLIDGLGYRSGHIGKRTRQSGTVITNKKTGRAVAIKTQQPCFNLHYNETKFDTEFVAENLTSLSYYEDAEVYDLEIDDEAHNFIADGLVVHNSPQEFQQILAARAASKLGGDSKVGMGGLDRIAALEDWEVAHFRLRGKQRRSIYGYSVLESARWIWKRLMLLEDAALIYRLQRAPERYAFYVDVGDLPPAEALAFVNRVRQQHKKTKYFNPTCLTADTCITCLDGVDRSIGELARDYADKQFGVFSYDLKAGRVVPGVASAPRKTGEQAAIWRVVLDNGAVVRCTANHPFLMRDGTYKAASDLTAYDSLMPLYMSRGSKGTQDYWMYEEPSTNKRTFVHKMVAESVYGADALKGMHVHHRNENKSDNTPDNLEPLTASDHLKRHPENALKGRLAFVARMKTDSEFSKTVVKRLEDWRVREPEAAKAAAISAGTVSMVLRKEQAENGQSRVLEFMESEVVRDPLVVVDDLVERLNSNPEFVEVYRQLPTTAHAHITTGCLHAFVRRQGFQGFKDFKIKKCGEAKWKNRTYGGEPTAAKQISNHKVVSSTFVGYEDVYNLDVADYHNFALTAGVFVHNSGKLDLKFNPISQDEDFFVPSRKGQDGTRIEVLGAPSWQHMEDIEYFRDKLFAAIKVPKAYMGQEAGIARQVLSSEDVRFARTVLRVQREMRNGLSKICRVHMMALNINPYNTDYDIRMTVPSSIFELAQLEVRNARADLAARMQSFVPMKFLMSNVFGFNDYDIEKIIKGQEEDTIRMGIVQVKAQIAAQKYQEEHAPAPQPGAEGAPGAPGAPGALPDIPQNPNVPVDPNVNVAAPNNPPMPPPAQGAQPPQQQQQRFNPVRFGNSLNEKRLLARGGLGFTEREMCEGSSSRKDKENYRKLEQLLKNDKQTAVRLLELRALVDDIRGSQRR